MSQTRKWSLLAALLVLAVFVGSWFLLIAPKRSKAEDLKSQTASQEQTNSGLVAKLQQLKAQSEDLPTMRARLAVVRQEIPDNPALPSLVRSLTKAGKRVGVDVVSLQPSAPLAVVSTATAPVAPTTSDTSTGDKSSASGSTGSAPGTVGTPAAAGPTLYQIPLTVKVDGSYFQVEQFVGELEKLRRAFMVNGFKLTTATDPSTGASTGDPTTAGTSENRLHLELTGQVFLSAAAPATVTPSAPVASPATAQ